MGEIQSAIKQKSLIYAVFLGTQYSENVVENLVNYVFLFIEYKKLSWIYHY